MIDKQNFLKLTPKPSDASNRSAGPDCGELEWIPIGIAGSSAVFNVDCASLQPVLELFTLQCGAVLSWGRHMRFRLSSRSPPAAPGKIASACGSESGKWSRLGQGWQHFGD
jgi:hypothetical protein